MWTLQIILDIDDSLDAHSQNIDAQQGLVGNELSLRDELMMAEDHQSRGSQDLAHSQSDDLEHRPSQLVRETEGEDGGEERDHPDQKHFDVDDQQGF